MVKHGRTKKRRAGRIGKTKLKNRTFQRWDPNPKISDPNIKKLWDPSKSPAVNLANMGLLAKPNVLHNKKDAVDEILKKPPPVIPLFDVPESDSLQQSQSNKKRHPMKKDDQLYISKCMSRYGDDYSKMYRDIKLNNMQYNENQLKKLGARFLLLEEHERVVDVPEKVQHLVDDREEEQK